MLAMRATKRQVASTYWLPATPCTPLTTTDYINWICRRVDMHQGIIDRLTLICVGCMLRVGCDNFPSHCKRRFRLWSWIVCEIIGPTNGLGITVQTTAVSCIKGCVRVLSCKGSRLVVFRRVWGHCTTLLLSRVRVSCRGRCSLRQRLIPTHQIVFSSGKVDHLIIICGLGDARIMCVGKSLPVQFRCVSRPIIFATHCLIATRGLEG